jgi:hypothetical protein
MAAIAGFDHHLLRFANGICSSCTALVDEDLHVLDGGPGGSPRLLCDRCCRVCRPRATEAPAA